MHNISQPSSFLENDDHSLIIKGYDHLIHIQGAADGLTNCIYGLFNLDRFRFGHYVKECNRIVSARSIY